MLTMIDDDTTTMPAIAVDLAARRRLEEFLAPLVPAPGQITIVELSRSSPIAVAHLIEEVLVPAATAWGWLAMHTTGGLPTAEFAASVDGRIAEVESTAAQLGIAPEADADRWIPWADALAKRHKLRMTVLSGASTPRAFRHRVLELNAAYARRGDKRFSVKSLGPVTMNESPDQAAALAKARRQYMQALDRLDRLNDWQTQRPAN
jgi:hypothetical protein